MTSVLELLLADEIEGLQPISELQESIRGQIKFSSVLIDRSPGYFGKPDFGGYTSQIEDVLKDNNIRCSVLGHRLDMETKQLFVDVKDKVAKSIFAELPEIKANAVKSGYLSCQLKHQSACFHETYIADSPFDNRKVDKCNCLVDEAITEIGRNLVFVTAVLFTTEEMIVEINITKTDDEVCKSCPEENNEHSEQTSGTIKIPENTIVACKLTKMFINKETGSIKKIESAVDLAKETDDTEETLLTVTSLIEEYLRHLDNMTEEQRSQFRASVNTVMKTEEDIESLVEAFKTQKIVSKEQRKDKIQLPNGTSLAVGMLLQLGGYTKVPESDSTWVLNGSLSETMKIIGEAIYHCRSRLQLFTSFTEDQQEEVYRLIDDAMQEKKQHKLNPQFKEEFMNEKMMGQLEKLGLKFDVTKGTFNLIREMPDTEALYFLLKCMF